MSARSRQRSYPRSPDRKLELSWTPRQELVDARAEAEIRDLEAKTAEDSRKAAAEIALLETQQKKLAGEVARQPLEAEEGRARIEESEARTIRIWVLTLLPPLLAAIALITGAPESTHLAGSGLDIISQKFLWLPRLR